MRTFVYIIGSTDDFESLEDLTNAYLDDRLSGKNASVYRFQLRADSGTDSMSVQKIAHLIGFGLAFSDDWCMEGTFSDLLET